MEAISKLSRTSDGRPIIAGCGTLPPIDARVGDRVATSDEGKKPNRKKLKHENRFAVLNAFVDGSLSGLSKADVATWLVLYRTHATESR